MTTTTEWRRLHPLSPVVRGGRATIGIVIVLVPSLAAGGSSGRPPYELVAVGVALLLGFVSWLVTRWRIDGDDLRIETGLLRRRSLRFPLAQLQAVDVVQPGLARMFALAELRLRMGGSTGTTARLAYLPIAEVEALRSQLLDLASGARIEEGVEAPPEPGEEQVLTVVPTGRLVASILLSDVGLYALALFAALVVALVLSPGIARAVLASSGTAVIVGAGTSLWRRFNQGYQLTVAAAHDGLRVRGGLVALTAETIRPGRVQAVRMIEPFLWRRLGWCRLEVDVAGRQRRKGEARAEGGRLRTVLPVGDRALAEELLHRILVEPPREQTPPPRRVLWKSPLRYRMLAWGRTDRCVAATSGRIRRVTSWVPLEKVQSLRRVQGPVQRRLRLASVHVDAAGRGVRAVLRDRDLREADRALADLVELARAARRPAAQRSPG